MKIGSLSLVIALATIAPCTFAQDAFPAMPVAEITKNIVSVSKKYADSISCGDTEISPKMIAALIPWTSDDDREDATYAVIWENDIGCAGGSGTSSSNILVVKIGAGSSFYVDPKLSSPVAQFDVGTRFISRLVGNTRDSLVLEGEFYSETDTNNSPSIKKKFTVRLDKSGNWVK